VLLGSGLLVNSEDSAALAGLHAVPGGVEEQVNISLAKIALVKRKANPSWQSKLMQSVAATEKKAGAKSAWKNYVWHDGSLSVRCFFGFCMFQPLAICRHLIR
jgi:hypothetical protein